MNKYISIFTTPTNNTNGYNAFAVQSSEIFEADNLEDLHIYKGELSTSKALKPFLHCDSVKENGNTVELSFCESPEEDGIKLYYKEWSGQKCVKSLSVLKMSYYDFYMIAEDLTDLPQTADTSDWFDSVLYKGLA